MRLAVVYSRTINGISAPQVTIEAHISPGLPGFIIVGLPEIAIKESRERIRSSIINSGYDFPAKKIIINLAPADLPKEGSKFDLPIALSILAASNQISKTCLNNYEFSGELALNGELRKISNTLPIAMATMLASRSLVLPQENLDDFLPKDIEIKLADNLQQVCGFLDNKNMLSKYTINTSQTCANSNLDFKDVYGQEQAKRAITIACAGRHNILMVGPPGTGKTMLASRISSILPPLTHAEMLEIAAIKSIKSPLDKLTSIEIPFRAPHHTASIISIIGGGASPKPGEISLAHCGVLFLDELTEFNNKVIDALREPLESKIISIARARHSLDFPANFMLVAAMNPCPCGNFGSKDKVCSCAIATVKRYLAKISGPILDRIDLKIYLPNISATEFMLKPTSNNNITSAQLRNTINSTRGIQQLRSDRLNAEYSNDDIKKYCKLNIACQKMLVKAIDKLSLPPRKCNKIIKVARTIADLEKSRDIQVQHISEAISYSLWRGGHAL